MGRVHTLTSCTHIFLVYIHCACTSHILVRVTHMHGSRVSAARMSSSLCHLTFSLLTRRCSCCSLTVDFSRPRRPHWHFCPRDPAELPRPKKRRSSALSTRTRSLATWPIPRTPQINEESSSAEFALGGCAFCKSVHKKTEDHRQKQCRSRAVCESMMRDLGFAVLVIDAKATEHILHRHGIGK